MRHTFWIRNVSTGTNILSSNFSFPKKCRSQTARPLSACCPPDFTVSTNSRRKIPLDKISEKKVTHYWKRPIYSWFTYWWWFSICSVSLPESILPNIPVPLAQAKSFWYQQTWIWASSATLVWICPASMLDRGSSWIPAQPLAKALGWRNMYENVRYITTYRYIMCLYIYIWNTYGYTGM